MNLDRLYFLRESKDLTQSDIAKELKVCREAISQWETSKEVIPIRKLNDYANYFNVNIDYILGLTDTKNYRIQNRKINLIAAGQRLKEFRKQYKLSQTKLANLLNTTHSTISAYESGKTLILTTFAYYIAKNYNISIDYLLCRTNINHKFKIKEKIIN